MKLFKIYILSMILEQVIFLADYYTDLVSSFRFVVIKEILGGGGGGYVRPAVWKNSLSLKSRCARDSD